MFTSNEHLTVSELNTLVRDVVNMGFPNPVWVCGEIQGYNRNQDKKHIFFELCEKDPQSKNITARIGLVVFSGRKEHINEVLKGAENAFQLKDDIEVKFLCRVDFYPPHGAMRLIVESIDPVYTLGKIAQEKQKLIALLKKKGVLEKNKNIPLPPVLMNIGLITAYDSAAYNDFLSELKMSGYGFKIFCRNTLMQGKGSEADVCRALDELRRIKTLDAVVITRGGGSIADLSCFDSEPIAIKIANSSLPILSGIGHEINITVTDLAAHTYQKTPTAIAQFLVERAQNFLMETEEKTSQIIQYARDRVEEEKRHLKSAAFDLQARTNAFLKLHHHEMMRFSEVVTRQPLRLLKTFYLKIKDQKEFLRKTVQVRFKNDRTKIHHYKRVMEIANPINTLKRGFSITRTNNGALIRSVEKVKPQDMVTTQLADGVLESQIHTIQKEDASGRDEI